MVELPPGFAPHFRKSPLTDPWEPLYSRRDAAGLTIGLQVREPHCNARGMAHGGLITALADNAMGLACALSGGGIGGLVTVTLAVDFVGSVAIGEWLEMAATPLRVGRTLAFATAVATVGERIVARANATFSISRPPTPPPAVPAA